MVINKIEVSQKSKLYGLVLFPSHFVRDCLSVLVHFASIFATCQYFDCLAHAFATLAREIAEEVIPCRLIEQNLLLL